MDYLDSGFTKLLFERAVLRLRAALFRSGTIILEHIVESYLVHVFQTK